MLMISVNYQSFGPGLYLRLRLYQAGETKYVNVSKLLKGSLQRRHWNGKKQRFIPSAPYSEENNHVLEVFRKPYDELALTWRGSLFSFIQQIEHTPMDDGAWTLEKLFAEVIAECKKKVRPDGTIAGTFECYEKAERRFKEFCEFKGYNYSEIKLDDVRAPLINDFLDYIRAEKQGKSLLPTSAMFHAILIKAEKMEKYDFSHVEKCRWASKKSGSAKKYEALTADECRRFVNLTLKELPRSKKAQLYRDFCVFIMYTCQSPCDAINLKYSDIQVINGFSHFVFKRRKLFDKQSVDCSVPINATMQEIIDRWRPYCKDGYILPIRNKSTIKNSKTNNGDIKHFISRINGWLKKLGKVLGLRFPLHNYVFRHTGITNYVSKGVPTVYVANLAGTSVENIEKIYYNNQGDTASRNKVLSVSF